MQFEGNSNTGIPYENASEQVNFAANSEFAHTSILPAVNPNNVMIHCFNESLSSWIKNFPGDMQFKFPEIFSEENPSGVENFQRLQKFVTAQFNILISSYEQVQEEHVRNLKEKDNLRIVNMKLLNRIKLLCPKNKCITSDIGIQVDDFSLPNSSLNFVDSPISKHDIKESAMPVNFKSPNSSSNASFYNLNNSFLSNDLKLVRVIIYRLTDDIDIPDIMESVYQIFQDKFLSIHFVKKYRMKNCSMFNYIIDMPHAVAKHFIELEFIHIRGQHFRIKPFIKATHCFRCQELSHMAEVCTKERVCAICGLNHSSNNCVNPPKCINCVNHNMKHNLQLKVDHPTFSSSCQYTKNFIKNARKALDTSLL